jgi:hypothetical protein
MKACDRLKNLIIEFINKDKLSLKKLPRNQDLWKSFLKELNYGYEMRFLIDIGTQNLKYFLKSVRIMKNL